MSAQTRLPSQRHKHPIWPFSIPLTCSISAPLTLGDIVVIAIDGDLIDGYNRIRIRKGGKAVVDLGVAELGHRNCVSFLDPSQDIDPLLLDGIARSLMIDQTLNIVILPADPEAGRL